VAGYSESYCHLILNRQFTPDSKDSLVAWWSVGKQKLARRSDDFLTAREPFFP